MLTDGSSVASSVSIGKGLGSMVGRTVWVREGVALGVWDGVMVREGVRLGVWVGDAIGLGVMLIKGVMVGESVGRVNGCVNSGTGVPTWRNDAQANEPRKKTINGSHFFIACILP